MLIHITARKQDLFSIPEVKIKNKIPKVSMGMGKKRDVPSLKEVSQIA